MNYLDSSKVFCSQTYTREQPIFSQQYKRPFLSPDFQFSFILLYPFIVIITLEWNTCLLSMLRIYCLPFCAKYKFHEAGITYHLVACVDFQEQCLLTGSPWQIHEKWLLGYCRLEQEQNKPVTFPSVLFSSLNVCPISKYVFYSALLVLHEGVWVNVFNFHGYMLFKIRICLSRVSL